MTVRDVLRQKGTHVYTIDPGATVLEATAMMNRHRIGALVVAHAGRLVGIFTERDVLMRVVGAGDISDLRVADVMTRDVITADCDTDLAEVSDVMRSRRIRHMPVVKPDGSVGGMISIGDVNAAYAQQQEMHLQHLEGYVYGRA